MNPAQKYFRPGQFLFHEGEPSHTMYLIKKGTVSIRKMKGAAYVEIARAYANEVVGELSFFDRQPRSAAAIALTEVESLEIDFDGLDKVWEKVPEYMRTIIACVAERLRKADDTIRRLQKDVVKEGEIRPSDKDQPSASDVLAATGNVASKETSPKESPKTATRPAETAPVEPKSGKK